MIDLARIEDVADKHFDYIIIGGGTTGLTIATRLSEDPNKTVLVLEAGGAHFDELTFSLPTTYGKFIGHKEWDWGFTTVPQKHAEGTTFSWPRPRTLGGGSAGNYYLWDRPMKEDINAWERLGNPGWNWDNYLKYTMKTETFIPKPKEVAEAEGLPPHDPKVHGVDGPIRVAFPTIRPGWDDIFTETMSKFGINPIDDAYAGDHVGVSIGPITVDPATLKRVSAVTYVQIAGARENLKILVNAHVSRILSRISEGQLVAEGVEFLFNGHTYTTSTDGEVIVSAGAIQSPHVLELSGIGDPRILGDIGVDTLLDLPAVGTNVQEHYHVAICHELKELEPWQTFDFLGDPGVTEEHLALRTQGKGLYGLGGTCLAMFPLQAVSERGAEIEKTLPTGSDIPGLAEQYVEQRKRIEEGAACLEIIPEPGFIGGPNPPTPGVKHFTVCTILQRPFSRGTIHSASKDPLDMPTIDPCYFEEEIDAQTLFELIKVSRKVLATEPLSSILGREINPGPNVNTDEQLMSWLKKYCHTTWHTTSTCSMLPRDKGGVVNPQLRVYGTQNIRVADLSIIPLSPCCHTQSVAYTIGEIAADIIKGAF